MKIKDSVALVTGSNRGIGRQFVAALLESRARRVYVAARRSATLKQVVALDPTRVVAVQLDITRPREVEAVARATQDLTLLINNAGVATFATIRDTSMEAITREMDTNYFGMLRVIRACLPALEKNGAGTVVNILSIAALAGMPGLGGYSASKAAAFSMTQALRGVSSRRKASACTGCFRALWTRTWPAMSRRRRPMRWKSCAPCSTALKPAPTTFFPT